ncbi:MAG: hypothetical protein J6Q77_02030 [Clostridia bacterium]|nr:hypothetical protein [Clostridia bacterium]
MYNYTARCRRFCSGGNERLRFEASVPVLENMPKISSFYLTLSQNCEGWCESVLFSQILERERNKTADTRRMRYSFSARIVCESQTYLCIDLKVFLRAGKESIGSFSEAHIWRKDTETLAPEKYALREISAELDIDVREISTYISEKKTPSARSLS